MGSGASAEGCAGAWWPSRSGRAGSSHGLPSGRCERSVSDRNTSSRSGVESEIPPTSMGSPRARRARPGANATPPSLGTWRVRASSSRVAPARILRRPFEILGGGERQLDVAAGHQSLQLVRCPIRDQRAAIEDPDAIGQSISLFEVLRRQEDRHAIGDEFPMICHISRRLRGSSPAVGSSRKMMRGSPIKVIARSRRRRIPPE